MNAPSVFLSYTGADNRIARRVYDDLKRSGYNVWSYEVDSILGVNYRVDFEHELKTRDYFCLLDSPDSRKSSHVQHECCLARNRQAQGSGFGVLPCLIVDRSPNWFDAGLLFPEQTMLQYVNLAQDYHRGMERLCQHMGNRKFLPFSDLPEDEEFQNELCNCPTITLPIYNELMALYRQFREACFKAPDQAMTWISSVIFRLKTEGAAGIATPWVALGVLQSNGGDYSKAAESFLEATHIRKEYDRAWCASAGANMALGKYSKALDDYRACQALLVPGHPNRDNLPIVVFGIAMAHLRLGSSERAGRAIDNEWTVVGSHSRILELRARIYLDQGRPVQALGLLEQARSSLAPGELPPVDFFLTFARAHRELGQPAEEQRIVRQAVEQFEKDPERLRLIVDQMIGGTSSLPLEFLRMAAKLTPDSPVYSGELASVLFALGNILEAKHIAEPCLWLEDKLNRVLSSRELYYQGLAFQILGKLELAQHALERAKRKDRLVASWPGYDQLLSRRISR